jgi:hypothetical protein
MMIRRNFLKRCLATVAALCGGAATVPAATAGRQVVTDLKLFRVGRSITFTNLPAQWHAIPAAKIGWFEQKPGDIIVGVRPDGSTEIWEPTGEPYWKETQPERWVETVKIDKPDDRFKTLEESFLPSYLVDEIKALL